MNKTFALAWSCLLLVSCGGGSTHSSCDAHYWNGTVGTCLPEGWEALDSETLRQRGVPEETVVAFQKTEAVSGQFPTVAITREKLATVVKPMQYSEASIRAIQMITDYKQIDITEYDVDGETVELHTFSGQPIEGEPGRRFYQLSTIDGNTGYTMTAVTPLSISNELEGQVQLMLKHFTFVEPTEEE